MKTDPAGGFEAANEGQALETRCWQRRNRRGEKLGMTMGAGGEKLGG